VREIGGNTASIASSSTLRRAGLGLSLSVLRAVGQPPVACNTRAMVRQMRAQNPFALPSSSLDTVSFPLAGGQGTKTCEQSASREKECETGVVRHGAKTDDSSKLSPSWIGIDSRDEWIRTRTRETPEGTPNCPQAGFCNRKLHGVASPSSKHSKSELRSTLGSLSSDSTHFDASGLDQRAHLASLKTLQLRDAKRSPTPLVRGASERFAWGSRTRLGKRSDGQNTRNRPGKAHFSSNVVTTHALDLSFQPDVVRLDALRSDAYMSLRSLDLSDCEALVDIRAIAALPSLRTLLLARCPSLVDASPCAALSRLETLDLSDCTSLASVSTLGKCNMLHTLNLSGCGALRALAGLAMCRSLHTLRLSRTQLRDIDTLDGLEALEVLDLRESPRLESGGLSRLCGCRGLRTLTLARCPRLRDLSHLSKCSRLRSLDVSGCESIDSVGT
jgi:Leucine-rich repeat (LRR) protein